MSRWLSGLFWLGLARWFKAKGLDSQHLNALRNAARGSGHSAAEASLLLAKRLIEADRCSEAETTLQSLLTREPGNARAWCTLGAALRHLARMDEAQAATRQALALDPSYDQAHCNLGEWLLVKGQPAAALEEFDRALQINPGLIEASNNRIAALYELGRYEEAEADANAAILRHPSLVGLYVNLGNILLHTGKARASIKAYRRALEIDPACPEALLNISTILGETHHLAEAQAYIEHEIAVKGESAQRLAALALAQQTGGQIAAAERTCRKALALHSSNISALITLASCLSARGDHRGAICLHEQALQVNANMPALQSNIAFDATYLPNLTPAEVFDFHRAWAQRFDTVPTTHVHDRTAADPAKRPLRIAYVSGDFGYHPVGFLIRDVLRHHDKQDFEIHCFSMMRHDDDITAEIRKEAAAWHDILLDSDHEVSDKIRAAGIDIAVDLSGHTAYNRLVSFAARPAPIQASWIGYFHSTGLHSIDYFITDPYTSPSENGQMFSEIPVYLPHSRFCYSPPAYAPAPAPPPFVERGHITFGCFNRLEKLIDEVIAVWAGILSALPDARLLLKAGMLDNPELAEEMRSRFATQGISPGRIELRGRSTHLEMLHEYADIDIALDPFPFNGGMTTLEALWMGVPVITCAGHGVVSRQTYSALANLGCQDGLAFPDANSYLSGAIALAKDPGRLARLRQELRLRMADSPLCQANRFTRDLETLYRRMWQAHCNDGKLEPFCS